MRPNGHYANENGHFTRENRLYTSDSGHFTSENEPYIREHEDYIHQNEHEPLHLMNGDNQNGDDHHDNSYSTILSSRAMSISESVQEHLDPEEVVLYVNCICQYFLILRIALVKL